jgi:pseudaminic acid biosynthesis-associated methylase
MTAAKGVECNGNKSDSRREIKRRSFKTAQEKFWAGEFGTSYIGRNEGAKLVASNVALFSRALRRAKEARDCIEFGANIGLNLHALKILYPGLRQYAVEINAAAAQGLEDVVPRENIYLTSILDFEVKRTYDLVIAKGILIHINPDYLGKVYEKLYRSCERYLLICEYYNRPLSLSYIAGTRIACSSVILPAKCWTDIAISFLSIMGLRIIGTPISLRTTRTGSCWKKLLAG